MTTDNLIEQYLDNQITLQDLVRKVEQTAQPAKPDQTLDIAVRFMAASLANPDIDDQDYHQLANEALEAAEALLEKWRGRS